MEPKECSYKYLNGICGDPAGERVVDPGDGRILGFACDAHGSESDSRFVLPSWDDKMQRRGGFNPGHVVFEPVWCRLCGAPRSPASRTGDLCPDCTRADLAAARSGTDDDPVHAAGPAGLQPCMHCSPGATPSFDPQCLHPASHRLLVGVPGGVEVFSCAEHASPDRLDGWNLLMKHLQHELCLPEVPLTAADMKFARIHCARCGAWRAASPDGSDLCPTCRRDAALLPAPVARQVAIGPAEAPPAVPSPPAAGITEAGSVPTCSRVLGRSYSNGVAHETICGRQATHHVVLADRPGERKLYSCSRHLYPERGSCCVSSRHEWALAFSADPHDVHLVPAFCEECGAPLPARIGGGRFCPACDQRVATVLPARCTRTVFGPGDGVPRPCGATATHRLFIANHPELRHFSCGAHLDRSVGAARVDDPHGRHEEVVHSGWWNQLAAEGCSRTTSPGDLRAVPLRCPGCGDLRPPVADDDPRCPACRRSGAGQEVAAVLGHLLDESRQQTLILRALADDSRTLAADAGRPRLAGIVAAAGAKVAREMVPVAIEGTRRVAARQLVVLARRSLETMLAQGLKLGPSARRDLRRFLGGALGQAVVALVVSVAVELLPLGAEERRQILAHEIRTATLADLGDRALDQVTGPLREMLREFLAGEAGPQVRVEAGGGTGEAVAAGELEDAGAVEAGRQGRVG
jgi:uncharacterized Zn finger protein (UPF0148 family)